MTAPMGSAGARGPFALPAVETGDRERTNTALASPFAASLSGGGFAATFADTSASAAAIAMATRSVIGATAAGTPWRDLHLPLDPRVAASVSGTTLTSALGSIGGASGVSLAGIDLTPLARFDRIAASIPRAAEIRAAALRAGIDPLLLAALVAVDAESVRGVAQGRTSRTGVSGEERAVRVFRSQFDGSRLQGSNCTMAAGAMLLAIQTGGRVDVSGGELRSRQRDHVRGTDLGDLAEAAGTLGESFEEGRWTFAEFKARSARGQAAVLPGLYARIPAEHRVQQRIWGDEGPHAILVDRYDAERDAFFVLDPLGRAGYQGAWIPADAIEEFAFSPGSFGGRATFQRSETVRADRGPGMFLATTTGTDDTDRTRGTDRALIRLGLPPIDDSRVTLDAFLDALGHVESRGRYDAVNEDSGAYGKYQIMPANWPRWATDVLGDANAAPTPENQERVARAKIGALHERYGDWRLVAFAWRNGERRIASPHGEWTAGTVRYVDAVQRQLGLPTLAEAAPDERTDDRTPVARLDIDAAALDLAGRLRSLGRADRALDAYLDASASSPGAPATTSVDEVLRTWARYLEASGAEVSR